MNNAKWLLPVLVVFSFTQLKAADVAVFPVFATNLTQAQGDAIGAILAQQFARISNKQVIGPAETHKALDTNSNNIQAAAKSLGVSQYLTINAIALQTNIIIDATLYDQMGSLQYRVQMTAGSLDDISEVSDRMARSLVCRLPQDQTRDLNNITQKETREKNRLFAEKVSGLKTSIIGSSVGGAMVEFGYNMRLESEKYFLEFGANGLFPADMSSSTGKKTYGGISLDMGGNWYLNSNPNMCPYIGGGLSPRLLISPSGVTVVPFVQAGLMFMRISSTRLYAEARLGQNVLPMKFGVDVYPYTQYDANGNPISSSDNHNYYPTEFGINIGIGW